MNSSERFGQFSAETQWILLASQELAEQRTHGVIGSEHLLLALLTVEQRSPARALLADFLIDANQAELALQLEPIIEEGRTGRDGLTDEARQVLEQSALQAIHTRATAIEPLHLLWAMVNDPTTTAALLLTKIGVAPEHLRNQLDQLFHEHLHVEHLIEQHLDLFELDGNLPETEPVPHASNAHPKKRPSLETLTTDLTALARANELDPMIGRQAELDRVIHVLLRRTKNNPVLVGEPGVGKTSIAEGLATRIATNQVPPALAGTTLRRLEVASLVAGTMYRGQFEERLQKLIAELLSAPQTILFIDEIHTIIGAGAAEGSLDAANMLKPALTSGKLRVIGATTFTEFQKYLASDAALERRFQPITVHEPSPADAVRMLQGLRLKLEAHHQLTIPDETLTMAVELAHRHNVARRLPDSAIDIVDEAAASTRAALATPTSDSAPQSLDRQLKTITQEKALELKRQNFERVAFLRDRELKLKLQLARRHAAAAQLSLSPAAVRAATARLTGIPHEQLATVVAPAATVAARLEATIVGQSKAIQRVAHQLTRSAAGLRPEHRPRSGLVFVGPSGVGKTELAYALADELFGTRAALIRLDMSEFREPHTVSRLVGAPPGYVGHDDAGRLTEAIRQRPASVVLFDEIDKAHPDVFNLLLQLLDYGRLTDSKGRESNFRSAHIVLTTNAGADHWRKAGIGFQSTDGRAAAVKEAATALFRPELLNRLDDIIVFEPLAADAIVQLIARELALLNDRLAPHGLAVQLARTAARELTQRALADPFGARGLQRLLATELETPVIERLAHYGSQSALTTLHFTFTHGQFALTPTTSPAPTPTV